MKYRVTITCVVVEEVEAENWFDAEIIAKESVRLGECSIVSFETTQLGDEEEEAA